MSVIRARIRERSSEYSAKPGHLFGANLFTPENSLISLYISKGLLINSVQDSSPALYGSSPPL